MGHRGAHALTTNNHRGLAAAVVAGVFALSGVTSIGVAVTHQQNPPLPPLSAVDSPGLPASAVDSLGPLASAVDSLGLPAVAVNSLRPQTREPASASRRSRPANIAPQVVGPVLPASAPLALDIPVIDVHSPLLQHVGQTAEGELAVPAPGPHYGEAAWYRYSSAPGSLGPAVIVGHLDSAANGPSVFFRLGSLRPRDTVRIARADGSVAVFAVDDVRRYRKTQFPTRLVYGDTNHAALRLITCGGPIVGGHYRDNIVVLASLVRSIGSRPTIETSAG
jgi:hypothetical protein